ncbi:MAG: DNA polymerase III subunit beta [Lachnospiraceae bacterium]|nr:DNA polymerase III subunit beta [Lachnospiraceae bacterium]
MKIICSKSDLVKAVNISMRAVPVRSTVPILECILMKASLNRITFTTNDMEMGIETIVPGSVIEEGMIAIDAKIFSDIVRKLPDADVTLTTDANMTATIVCGKTKFNVSGHEGDDFTDLPAVEKEDCIEISQLTLKETINRTIFSTAQSENNKLMTGELFEINGSQLKVVSLDGHRVAIRRVELKEVYSDKKVVVPGKTLQEMSKILSSEADDTVNLYFMNNHIVFDMPGTTVVSTLIEGEFFDIDHMLSKDYETRMNVNRQTLLSSIDRSTLFVREGDKKPIIMDIHDGFMKMTIDSPIGSMDEDIDIEKEGRDIMIGFNPKFMIDALKAISDEDVTLYLLNPKAPCFIRDENETYTYIVLPVNFVK